MSRSIATIGFGTIAAPMCAAIALAALCSLGGCASGKTESSATAPKYAVLTPPQLQKVLAGRTEAQMPTAEGRTPPAGSSAPSGGPKLPPQFQHQ